MVIPSHLSTCAVVAIPATSSSRSRRSHTTATTWWSGLRKQVFYDGKGAMWGGSYAGFDQWATAKELPPHLATIVSVAAAHPPLDYPSLTSIALWSDLRRLRYRESKLAKPGEIVKCEFNPGLFIARKLMKGSRLRLVVSSPNSIFWQKNYCSSGVVVDETAKDARACHVKVYHTQITPVRSSCHYADS
jgi:predicted acyl esterase